MENRLTEGELRRRRQELHVLAGHAEMEPGAELLLRYGLDGPQGRQLYESCSDQELLDLLRERAEELGRSPAQNEVHWTCRTYLRARFKNWPGALRAAGLSRSAGRCGKRLEEVRAEETEVQRLLEEVRRARETLGRMPHPSDLPEALRGLRCHYKTWGEVLSAAGVLDPAPLPPTGLWRRRTSRCWRPSAAGRRSSIGPLAAGRWTLTWQSRWSGAAAPGVGSWSSWTWSRSGT